MGVCDFELLNSFTLESAKKALRQYTGGRGSWSSQYDIYFNSTQVLANPGDRLVKLLDIVRLDGWGMNRKGQCTHIISAIGSGKISNKELEYFWRTVYSLPDVTLRDLPDVNCTILTRIEGSFDEIRKVLGGWQSSAGTLCFLTKVILMFNWGQSPAFDTRIRSVLKVNNLVGNKDLVRALVEIGVWIRNFESRNGILLDNLATKEMMKQKNTNSLSPLPLGRSFDMMLFPLDEKKKGKNHTSGNCIRAKQ